MQRFIQSVEYSSDTTLDRDLSRDQEMVRHCLHEIYVIYCKSLTV
jgi:hypothetical protein